MVSLLYQLATVLALYDVAMSYSRLSAKLLTMLLAWLSALQRPKLLTGSRFRPCLLIYTTRVQYCTEHGLFLLTIDSVGLSSIILK